MPYTLTYQDGILRVELAGVITGEDLLRLDEEIRRVRGPGGALPNRVTDLTATTRSPVGFAEVFTLVQGRRERAAVGPARLALVAPTPVQKGFARMFQTMSDPAPHRRPHLRRPPVRDGVGQGECPGELIPNP